jgi:hypothetical protein
MERAASILFHCKCNGRAPFFLQFKFALVWFLPLIIYVLLASFHLKWVIHVYANWLTHVLDAKNFILNSAKKQK